MAATIGDRVEPRTRSVDRSVIHQVSSLGLGWRAEKAQPGVEYAPPCEGAAPFGAPPGQRRPGLFAASSFRHRAALCPRNALLHLRLRAHGAFWVNRSFAASDFAWRPPSAMLLAGPRSGAGRSPDAARVRGERCPAPAGAAPALAGCPAAALEGEDGVSPPPHPSRCSIARRLATTPLDEQGEVNVEEDCGGYKTIILGLL